MYISIQNQNITKWSNKSTIIAAAVATNTCTIAPVLTSNVTENTATASCTPMNSVSSDFVALTASNSKISFSPKNSKTIPPMDVSAKISNVSKCTAAVIDKAKNAIQNYVNVKAAKMIPMDFWIEKRKNFSFKSANNNLLKDRISICTHSAKTKSLLIPQVILL